eukprot:m.55893 g.55893  ORF g.55893 m.55893 type:complete len:1072 (-) comp11999_c1_seq2:92-3307(-)
MAAAAAVSAEAPTFERTITLKNEGAPLGITFKAKMSAEKPKQLGAIVSKVTHGSQADKAGLRENDFIAAIDGENMANTPLDRILDILRSKKGAFTVTVKSDSWYFLQTVGGEKFYKVRKSLYQRTFFLSADKRKLRWESKKKEPRESFLFTSSIKKIIKGTASMVVALQELSQGDRDKVTTRAEQCFTVVYAEDGEPYRELHLMAPSPHVRDIWCSGLEALAAQNAAASLSTATGHFGDAASQMVDLFDYGSNFNTTITKDQCKALMHHLNCNISARKIDETFKAVSRDGKPLSCDQFSTFFQTLRTYNEMTEIREKYFVDGTMPLTKLLAFLQNEQGVILTEREGQLLIDSFEPSQGNSHMKRLSQEGLSRYLMGPDGNAWNQDHSERVYQNMSHPLTHYFISSSHNTYLVDHQLYGLSAVEMYARAFQLGCKCVELDCWDGEDGEPVIYHGHTLTSKIKFVDVIKAVKKYGFCTSVFPVILSLEVHTSIEQQQRMARILRENLGEMLHIEPNTKEKPMPSPHDLRGRILIKGKKLPPGLDEVSEDDEAADIAEEDMKDQPPAIRKKLKTKKSVHKKKLKLSDELSGLVSYIRGVHFTGFKEDYSNAECDNIVSFSEIKALEHLNNPDAARKFVARNKKQMTRTYPAGFRVTSSNYDPIPMWNGGSQLVALNYQTPSHELCINHGKFRDNGGVGYLLKPAILRDLALPFNPADPASYAPDDMRYLTIRIISGQTLPKPGMAKKGEIIDPYVVVEILGVETDRKEVRTRTVDNNGFNPVWDTSFGFRVQVPDLAMVYFKVYDEDEVSGDDFIGQCAIPFHSLCEGYRHVHIRAKSDELYRQSTIFIHVSKSRTAEAIHLSDLARTKSINPNLTPLSRPNLEETFRQVAPLALQPREFNEKITLAVKKFITSLGMPPDNSFAYAVDEFRARIAAQGGSLVSEEVLIPNTSLSTVRLVTEGLPADQVRAPAVNGPLRAFEYLRSVIEDVMRIQTDQTVRLQQGIATLVAARSTADVKDKRLITALDERVSLLQSAADDYGRTLTVIREMMRLTHEKVSSRIQARRGSRAVLNM